MSQADLLIEIACEELPARFVTPLVGALAAGIEGGLADLGIAHGELRSYATPRRIAVLIEAVSTQQPDQHIERRGPAVAAAFKDGAPTKAAEGFARGCGVTVAELETIETDKGAYLNFRRTEAGQPTTTLLQGIFEATIKKMDELVPKRMRWGTGDASFVRPVHSLTALLGSEIVPLKAFGLSAGRICHGHRFHAPEPISLAQAADYPAAMQAASVIADFGERRERVRALVEDASQGRALIDEDLLDEVTALLEWPEPVLGSFDEAFLQLPEEVIVTTIQEHQRYFPVYGEDQRISRQFVTLANLRSKDPAAVVAGNEKVVRPRLADALFFWEQDLKAGFETWLNKLEGVTYITGLGSMADKSRRMESLARAVAPAFGVDAQDAASAARLAKADLASQMVFEMPELQGIMGGHYARAQNLAPEICDAISQHYLPQGPEDAIPGSPLGAALALADKLDALLCLFSQEALRPTSSKDPYGARRAALGVIRILGHYKQDLALWPLLEAHSMGDAPVKLQADDLAGLLKFLEDRLRVWLLAQDLDARVVEAVLARDTALDVHDCMRRCHALQALRDSTPFEQLAAANKRIRNILKDGTELSLKTELLAAEEEKALLAALQDGEVGFNEALERGDYVAAMHRLAELSGPITAFFNEVLVNAEDAALREARHALLQIFARRCGALADFAALSHG